jgi:glycolate oxidase iron-sulfur subunit
LRNSSPRVLYYAGCLIQRFYPEIGHSSVNVLRKNKVEVIVKEEKCCGIQALASGYFEGARKLAGWNIDSFLQEEVEAIVTSCPTCSMVFKEYPWLFRKEGGEPLQKAREVSKKIYDFSDFLINKIEFDPPAKSIQKRITYHDPCHLKYAQGVGREPRKLIQAIKGIEYIELERPDLCCGFGGFFSFEHFDLSAKINDRLLDGILKSEADVVIDACPPCILKLKEGFYRRKIKGIEIKHISEILSEAY